MDRREIIEKLKDVFNMALNTDGEDVQKYTEDSNLVTDLGLSSVGVLYAVIAIEEFFNIRFDDVEFGDFVIVKDVIDYIEKKVNE
ncbi:MAG: acyl carrier protein [Clostridiales bacterium]|nr:acyl carrier protein [Clostridiales bacterium]